MGDLMSPTVHILGGGTFFHIRPHFSICAPAFGSTATWLATRFEADVLQGSELYPQLHFTRMANPRCRMETNADVAERLDGIIKGGPNCKIVIMSVALCDWEAVEKQGDVFRTGKNQPRLKTSEHALLQLGFVPAAKLIGRIRKTRKDIFLVGCKTTTGATPDEQFTAGLHLLKEASANLILANDLHTRQNMIVTPEEARYTAADPSNREATLELLYQMIKSRSNLTFTRSTVKEAPLIAWDDCSIPSSLRTVVDHCIKRGAYKPFRGSTVGHFAVKVDNSTFITSIRKSNFNELANTGMVLVESTGPDHVIAYGAKPSVGGQSQRIIFKAHPGYDCIVHFHCPLKTDRHVNTREQIHYECGSHECGQNASDGLEPYGDLKAVMLDKHGPNIVFKRDIDPNVVIDFIETNWDLEGSTRNV
jgi:hypothetical protein